MLQELKSTDEKINELSYSAEGLYRFMCGYTPDDELEIEFAQNLGKIKVRAMYGEWSNLLFLEGRDIGSRLEQELKTSGMDKEFYYYFFSEIKR